MPRLFKLGSDSLEERRIRRFENADLPLKSLHLTTLLHDFEDAKLVPLPGHSQIDTVGMILS